VALPPHIRSIKGGAVRGVEAPSGRRLVTEGVAAVPTPSRGDPRGGALPTRAATCVPWLAVGLLALVWVCVLVKALVSPVGLPCARPVALPGMLGAAGDAAVVVVVPEVPLVGGCYEEAVSPAGDGASA
jgi:hypothetical protein